MAKRILIYTNHYYPEQFKINEIVDWLSKQDFEIRIVTGIPNYPSGKYYKGYGLYSLFDNRAKKDIVVNRLPLIPRGNAKFFRLSLNYLSYFISSFFFTIYLLIFKKKFDYIFVHHTSPFLIAIHPVIYGLFYKTKKYLWDLDIWPETLEAMNAVKSKKTIYIIEKIIIYIYSFYDTILIGSKGFRSVIEKRFTKQIIYFPNWAESDIENNKCEKEVSLNLPDNKFIIMYTGNIGEAQNFNSLIDTIKILNHENIQWVFIGGGRYKNEFIAKLIENKILDNCTFINQIEISEIPCYSRSADFMFLSLKKNSIFSKTVPAKLQSYMALGKPVIGVLQGEGVDIIRQAKCGIIQQNADYTELAAQIKEVLKLPKEEMQKMGQNGREYYEKFFSQEKRKTQILNLFK